MAAGHSVRQAERKAGLLESLHGFSHIGVVPVGHHMAVLGRNQLREFPEGALNVLQVLEEVQVVGLHIEDHRHRGGEGQKGVAVFAGLGNDGVPVSHPVAAAQNGQSAPDHHRGVPAGGQKMWVHMEVVVVLPWVPATHRAFL